MIKQIVSFIFLISGLIQPLFALAQEDENEVPAAPALVELPPMTKSYKSFYSTPQLDFAIGLDSIAVQPSEENEIRYILKATSKQGAVNISYEGIRCDHRQKIIYAIGLKDGSWKRARSPEWSPIAKTGNNLQHIYLANDYFCTGGALSGTSESMRNRIQRNKPLNAYGF
jgi:hypothetical protein